MKYPDEARGSGDSRGVDRNQTTRYVLDIIAESEGPRKATAQGSVIHFVRRGPGSQTFLGSKHSVGIVLAPAAKLRASPGSDRLTEYHAPVGCLVINPAGVDSRLAWSATRENAVIMRKIRAAELASVAGVSPNHFIARFATTFGMPPHRYLINLRLDFAEKLLLDGELAIAEVAYLAGFLDQSHLAPMKKYRGRTPRTAYASARTEKPRAALKSSDMHWSGKAATPAAQAPKTGISYKDSRILQNTSITNVPMLCVIRQFDQSRIVCLRERTIRPQVDVLRGGIRRPKSAAR